jgi:hypothetical protein
MSNRKKILYLFVTLFVLLQINSIYCFKSSIKGLIAMKQGFAAAVSTVVYSPYAFYAQMLRHSDQNILPEYNIRISGNELKNTLKDRYISYYVPNKHNKYSHVYSEVYEIYNGYHTVTYSFRSTDPSVIYEYNIALSSNSGTYILFDNYWCDIRFNGLKNMSYLGDFSCQSMYKSKNNEYIKYIVNKKKIEKITLTEKFGR